jgi:peptidoglycan/LPS O-acetylase OafA/YrhL
MPELSRHYTAVRGCRTPPCRSMPVKHSAKAADKSARPGDAGRARSRLAVQLPYLIVLAGVAAGLLTVRGGNQAVRGGTLVVAGALLAGALARLVLPERRVGMLASRRRLVDVAALAILGIGLLVAGLIAKVPGS